MSGGQLCLYVLGPGVGEAVVARLPNGRILVVDSCTRGGENLVATLLRHLGVAQIDLLVITHPDLDHVKGLCDLITQFSPCRVWRYPFGLLREALQHLGGLQTPTGAPRYAEALAVNQALDDLLESSGTVEHVHPGRFWRPPDADYTIWAVAPTHYDIKRAMDRVRGLVIRRGGRTVLSDTARAWFAGGHLGDLPNLVSLGLLIECGDNRVLLAGDVENGNGSPYSGWPGVLAALDEPDEARGHLVNDLRVVKVAHHGSASALSEEAWNRHSPTGAAIGVMTTYSPTPLPDDVALWRLRRWVSRLGVTTDQGDSFERALRAGWVAVSPAEPSLPSLGPCLKVTLEPSGVATLERGDEAGWFR